jgi:hypothetical protein
MGYWAEHDGYGVLDDDMPDAFNDWICDADPTELIDLANKYAVLWRNAGTTHRGE